MSGIINTIGQTAQDAVDYVTGNAKSGAAEASAKANKETVKSDSASLGTKINAAGDYLTDKKDQHSENAKAEVAEQKLKN